MTSAVDYDEFVARVRDAPEPYEIAKSFTVSLEGSLDPIIEKQLFAIWLGFTDMFDGRGPDRTAEASADMRRFAAEWLALVPRNQDALRAYLDRWTDAYGPPSWH